MQTCGSEKKCQVMGIQELHAGDPRNLGVVVAEIILTDSTLPVPYTRHKHNVNYDTLLWHNYYFLESS